MFYYRCFLDTKKCFFSQSNKWFGVMILIDERSRYSQLAKKLGEDRDFFVEKIKDFELEILREIWGVQWIHPSAHPNAYRISRSKQAVVQANQTFPFCCCLRILRDTTINSKFACVAYLCNKFTLIYKAIYENCK